MRKIYLTMVLAATLTAFSAGTSFAGQWVQDGSGWKYQREDTSFQANGWQWINDKCYYFTPEGRCLMNTGTPDGYTVDASGAWIVNGVLQQRTPVDGWNQVDGGWKYYVNKKYVTSGWKPVDGKRYYFNENSLMVTGFQDINGDQYYFNGDGSLMTSSFTLDDIRYVVGSNGIIRDQMDEFDWYAGNYSTDYDSSSSSGDESGYASDVYDLINERRESGGKNALIWDEVLAACAQQRAEEISEKFSHTRPDGTSFQTTMEEEGISFAAAGENIASGQRSAQSVVNSWMRSTGHKNSIMDSTYNHTGVGCAYIDGTYYWVQIFTD